MSRQNSRRLQWKGLWIWKDVSLDSFQNEVLTLKMSLRIEWNWRIFYDQKIWKAIILKRLIFIFPPYLYYGGKSSTHFIFFSRLLANCTILTKLHDFKFEIFWPPI